MADENPDSQTRLLQSLSHKTRVCYWMVKIEDGTIWDSLPGLEKLRPTSGQNDGDVLSSIQLEKLFPGEAVPTPQQHESVPPLFQRYHDFLTKIVDVCNDLALWCDTAQLCLETNSSSLSPRFLAKTDAFFTNIQKIDNDNSLAALTGKQACQWDKFKKNFLENLTETTERKAWIGPHYKDTHEALCRSLLSVNDSVAKGTKPKLRKLRYPPREYPKASNDSPISTAPMSQFVEKCNIWVHSRFERE
ncbi:hypothetical protein MMC10_007033 [Thelotrema lepadinum]|nr:hypothetical protein [Thelotrema lepadinum]